MRVANSIRNFVDQCMKALFRLIFILSPLVLIQCQTEQDPIVVDRGFEYYPLYLGHERTYLVERVDFYLDANSGSVPLPTIADTSHFLIREVINGIDDDLEGNQFFLEHSFSKADTSVPWPLNPDSIYQVGNNNVYLNKNRNNRVVTELRFPIQNGASWNGNAFNNLDPEIFVVDSIDFSVVLDTTKFENCMRVMKSDIENLIEKNLRWEIYALGTGPILKSFEVHQYKQNISASVTGIQRIESGYQETWAYYVLD